VKFPYRSRYPVVLSFENHCSVAQQRRMAEIILENLGPEGGDFLPRRDELRNFDVLPSPEALAGKVLQSRPLFCGLLLTGFVAIINNNHIIDPNQSKVRSRDVK
jgi:hypothetical protein